MSKRIGYFSLIKTIIELTKRPESLKLSKLSDKEIIKILKMASVNRVLFLLCKNIKEYNYLNRIHGSYFLVNKIFLRGQEINNHYAALLRKVKRLFETNNISYLIVKTDRRVDHVLSDIDILIGKENFDKARELLGEMSIDKKICEKEARWHFKFENEVQLDIHRIGEDWYSDDFLNVADIWKNIEQREFLGNVYPFPAIQIEWILNALNIIYEKWSITYLDLLFFQKSKDISHTEVDKIAKAHGWYTGLQIFDEYINKVSKEIGESAKGDKATLPRMFSCIDFLKIFIVRLFSPYKNYRISLFYFFYFIYCKIRFILTKKSRIPFYGSWFNFGEENTFLRCL